MFKRLCKHNWYPIPSLLTPEDETRFDEYEGACNIDPKDKSYDVICLKCSKIDRARTRIALSVLYKVDEVKKTANKKDRKTIAEELLSANELIADYDKQSHDEKGNQRCYLREKKRHIFSEERFEQIPGVRCPKCEVLHPEIKEFESSKCPCGFVLERIGNKLICHAGKSYL